MISRLWIYLHANFKREVITLLLLTIILVFDAYFMVYIGFGRELTGRGSLVGMSFQQIMCEFPATMIRDFSKMGGIKVAIFYNFGMMFAFHISNIMMGGMSLLATILPGDASWGQVFLGIHFVVYYILMFFGLIFGCSLLLRKSDPLLHPELAANMSRWCIRWTVYILFTLMVINTLSFIAAIIFVIYTRSKSSG